MNSFHSVLNRRHFILTTTSSLAVSAFGGFSRTFDLLFGDRVAKASETKASPGKKALKGCVVYYSATGSTAKVAKAIHRGMKGLIACDIFPIKEADPKKMAAYDVIAIGGPIWYSRETANLKLFINKMPDMTGKLCIPFCTHGTGPDGFLYSISKNLLKKSFTIIGWNDWYGSVFHVLHQPKPYLTDGHPDKIDLSEAEAFGKEMAERAQKIYAGEKSLIPEIPIGNNADTLWVPSNMSRSGPGDPGGLPGGSSGSKGVAMPMAAGAIASGAPGGMPGAAKAGASGGMSGSASNNRGRASGGTASGPGGPASGGPPPIVKNSEFPKIDLTKFIYPRCTSCGDNCIMNAIDFSMMAQAVSLNKVGMRTNSKDQA
jgi:flavodoxin